MKTFARTQILQSLIVIITFVLAYHGSHLMKNYLELEFASPIQRLVYVYSWWIILPIIITGLLFGFKNVFKELGIDEGFLTGLLFGLITVSPMLLSSALFGSIRKEINLVDVLHKTIIAGFSEEFLFRAFLFGILYRRLGWGFIPSSLLGALIFGVGHLYQGTTLSETAGVFMVTAMGAIWFAWLLMEWDNKLWVPIFLHTFMNLSWILFEVSDNALGGVTTNVFRGITIALTIIITIYLNKKTGRRITKKKLLFNS